MIGLFASLAAIPLLAAGAFYLVRTGTQAGDRPGDVTVTAEAGSLGQPDGRWPAAVVTVRNPGPVPVLIGLSTRAWRVPGWLDGGRSVSAPARTLRRRLRPDRQELVGVVGPAETAQWRLPVPRGRRRLVAVVGQPGNRLRVIRAPLPPMPPPAPAACGARTLTEQDR